MKYDHEVIRDLMPLCIDGIASEKSRQTVEAHLKECPDCAKEWKSMQQNTIQTEQPEAVLQETQGYAKTATRVRKHHRWMLLRIFLLTLAFVFVLGIIANYADGARFSPRGVMKYMVKEELWEALYETPEEWQNSKMPEITYLGTLKSSNKKAAAAYCLLYQADNGQTALCMTDAERTDPLRLGMWISSGMAYGNEIPDKGIAMSYPGGTYDNCSKGYQIYAFYVTDARVRSVSFTVNGTAYTMTPDKNGFCGIWTDCAPSTAEHLAEEPVFTDGTATDADGNVLYTLETVTMSGAGSEWEVYEWQSAK